MLTMAWNSSACLLSHNGSCALPCGPSYTCPLQHVGSLVWLPEEVEEAAKEAIRQRLRQQQSPRGLSVKEMEAIATAEAQARGSIWQPRATWLKDLRAELGIARVRRK